MPCKLNERGMVLGVVVAMAVVFAIAAFGIMTLSVNRGQTSSLQAHRLKAQYAAEAGIVWAMQRLWVDQAYCGAPDPPSINGMAVDVTVTGGNCATPPTGSAKTISANVNYTYN